MLCLHKLWATIAIVFTILFLSPIVHYAQQSNSKTHHIDINITDWEKRLQRVTSAEGVSLPFPNGTYEKIFIYNVMRLWSDGMRAQYPSIRTFKLTHVQKPDIHGRLTFSPYGLHAYIFTPDGTVMIRPEKHDWSAHHLVYYDSDEVLDAMAPSAHQCIQEENDKSVVKNDDLPESAPIPNGATKKNI